MEEDRWSGGDVFWYKPEFDVRRDPGRLSPTSMSAARRRVDNSRSYRSYEYSSSFVLKKFILKSKNILASYSLYPGGSNAFNVRPY